MTVYQPLGDYLARLTADHANLTFVGIEHIIGRPLPPSARTRSVWWANNRNNPGRQCQVWLKAGWKVDSIDMAREMVSFVRERRTPARAIARPTTGNREVAIPKTEQAPRSVPRPDSTQEWYWEGNVQAALIRFLSVEGWSIRRVADTAGHEHGIDVLAARDGRLLAVEVKGYPPSVYTFGRRKGELKPVATSREQAEKFFAQALHAAIRTKTRSPNVEVALAFPSHYEATLEEARWALTRLGVGVYLVAEDGGVRVAVAR